MNENELDSLMMQADIANKEKKIMSLRTNRESVKDWKTTCFVCLTEDDLEEGVTLDMLVNPPVEEKANEDGTTTRYLSANPTPWFYEKEDKTRIWKLSSVTFSLEQGSMLVGLGEITENNWQEFWTRVNLCERTIGCFRADDAGNELFISPDDVKAHIGLRANVSPIGRSKFNNKVIRWLRESAKGELDELLRNSATREEA